MENGMDMTKEMAVILNNAMENDMNNYVGAPTVKAPELLCNIEEVHKAVETVRCTTGDICNLLRVRLVENIKAQELVPAPTPPLITERCAFLSELRASLYTVNEQLRVVLETLQEI